MHFLLFCIFLGALILIPGVRRAVGFVALLAIVGFAAIAGFIGLLL